jgi:hypothetical protein
VATLSAHLRRPDAHAGLPFHADCPICRDERLVGTLASRVSFSSRAQAVLAAGVLAFTTTASAALAAEGDSQQDGTAAVTQTSGGDSSQSPDFDPGGSSDDLPAQAPALPGTQAPPTDGNDDTGAIDQQPTSNTNDPVVDQGDGSNAQSSQPQSTSPMTAGDPSPATPQSDQTATQTPAPQPTATAPAQPTQSTPSTAGAEGTPQPGSAPRSAPSAQRYRRHRAHRATRIVVHRTQTATPVATTTPPPAVSLPAAVTRSPAASIRAADRAKPGDRTHTVQAGESLWSIASDFLGSDASPARVAREVNRLWELNRDRIGTGNPDLLMVGTTLRLP